MKGVKKKQDCKTEGVEELANRMPPWREREEIINGEDEQRLGGLRGKRSILRMKTEEERYFYMQTPSESKLL